MPDPKTYTLKIRSKANPARIYGEREVQAEDDAACIQQVIAFSANLSHERRLPQGAQAFAGPPEEVEVLLFSEDNIELKKIVVPVAS